jgi:Cu(I)/Ag(I) efflux system membrane fusion protein
VIKQSIRFSIFLALITFINVGIVYLIKSHSSVNAQTSDKKPLYWVDAMEPSIHYEGPGKSRMNMELTPVYGNEQEKNTTTISISPQLVNNLGVRTEVVKEEEIAERVKAYGYISLDENKITHLHSYADGWVRKLFVKASGEPVKKGQPLIGIYAPKLLIAQSELVLSLKMNDKDSIELTRGKLRALNVTEDQIDEITREKHIDQLILMLSPRDGVIEALEIREGMYVTPQTTVLSIVDPSTLWVNLEIFPSDASKIKAGQDVEIALTGEHETPILGKINYIYPQIDPQTKTLRARVLIENPEGILKAGQLVSGVITVGSKKAITIDKQGIIYGSKTNRVIVMKENGQFEPKLITLGLEDGARVEVTYGLKAKERVVTSGQFLIDSEADLKGALERLSPPTASIPVEHHHHAGMKMP